jgi:hypothetical protein
VNLSQLLPFTSSAQGYPLWATLSLIATALLAGAIGLGSLVRRLRVIL